MFSITLQNTNCSFQNTSTSIEENASYSNLISPNNNYRLIYGDIVVLMGGEDISDSALTYVNNEAQLNIQAVTGDLIITAIASPQIFTVKLFIDNCILTNNETEVEYGSTYINTLVPTEGYLFIPNSTYAKMGNTNLNITPSATYIHIETTVSSNIIICACAAKASGVLDIANIKFERTGNLPGIAKASAENCVDSLASNSVTMPFVQLPVPEHFILTDTILSWESVNNAYGYEIYHDNTKLVEIPTAAIDLSNYFQAVGSYNIYVVALGKGFNVSSNKSAKFTYVIEQVLPTLAKPVNLNISNDILTWSAVTNATSYRIYSNGSQLGTSSSTSYSLASLSYGTFDLQVQAIANGYNSSEKSDPEEYVINPIQLPAPTNLGISGKSLTWNPVANAGSYTITLSTGVILSVGKNTTSKDLSSYLTNVGTYTATVKAGGSGRYIASEPSDAYTILITALQIPNISITSNGVLSWEAITNASQYDVYLNSSLKATTSSTSINMNNYISTAGTYSIYIIAKSSSLLYINAKSNTISYTVESIQLDTPTITLTDSTISWSSIPHATRYQIFINNTNVSNTTSTSYNLEIYLADKAAATYTAYIRAIGTGIYTTSNPSNDVLYTVLPVQLSIPTGANISTTTLTWNAVPNGKNYTVKIVGPQSTSFSTNSRSVNLRSYISTAGTYDVSIKANSWGRYLESSYCDPVEYIMIQLSAPTNLAIQNTILSWTGVEHASSYSLYNGATMIKDNISSTATSIDLKDIIKSAGNYTLTLKAIGTGIYLTSVNSDSVSYTVTKLTTPTLGIVSGELYWNNIPNAQSYSIFMNNSSTAWRLNISTLGYSLVDNIDTVGTYTFKVRAVAAGLYVTSDLSNSVTYVIDESSILTKPANLRINGNELTWNAVTNATRYEVECVDNSTSTITTFNVSVNTVNLSTYLTTLSTYTIRVRAKASGFAPSQWSNTVQFNITPINLPVPTGISISNNIVSWNPVENASGYEISYQIGQNPRQVITTTVGLSIDLSNYLTLAQTYPIQVKALGSGIFSDSVYSTAISFTIYSITYILTNCTSSNTNTAAFPGSLYTSTITASTGYTLEDANVVILQGITDITASVYANGTISISNISDNISITISAVYIQVPDAPIISILDAELTISEISNADYYTLYDTDDDSLIATIYPITTTLTGCSEDSSNYNTLTIKPGVVTSTSLVFNTTGQYQFDANSEVIVTGADYAWSYATGTLVLSNPTGKIVVSITASLVPGIYELVSTRGNDTQPVLRMDWNTVKSTFSAGFVPNAEDPTKYDLTSAAQPGFHAIDYPWMLIFGNDVINIGRATFGMCDMLKKVIISDSIQTIERSSFTHSGLQYIDLGQNASSIGIAAFDGCAALSQVIMGDSIQTIGQNAFASTGSNMTLIYTGTLANWLAIDTTISLFTKFSTVMIDGEELGDIEIPSNITIIRTNAFGGCSTLTSVIIPDSVTSVGDQAFAVCPKLSTITIGANLTTIGNYVFAGTPFSSITISPNNSRLTMIDNYLIDTVTQSILVGTTSSASLPSNSSIITIGDGALAYRTDLINVIIPANITEIGRSAFQGCSNLQSITLSGMINTIGNYSFNYCSKLTDVNYGGTISAWNTLVPNWQNVFSDMSVLIIHCIDGDIPLKYPSKGMLINMDLDGTTRTYRILSSNNAEAQVLGMFSLGETMFNTSNRTATFTPTSGSDSLTGQNYNGSAVDIALNTTWYNTLSQAAKDAIIPQTRVQDMWIDGDDTYSNVCYGTYHDYDTGETEGYVFSQPEYFQTIGQRNVYALTVSELREYLHTNNIDYEHVQLMFWNKADEAVEKSMWFCTASGDDSDNAWNINGEDGALGTQYYNELMNIIPALTIDLSQIDWVVTDTVLDTDVHVPHQHSG